MLFPSWKLKMHMVMRAQAGDGDNCKCKVEAVTLVALKPIKSHHNWLLIGVINMIRVERTIPLKRSDWSLRDPEPAYCLQKQGIECKNRGTRVEQYIQPRNTKLTCFFGHALDAFGKSMQRRRIRMVGSRGDVRLWFFQLGIDMVLVLVLNS